MFEEDEEEYERDPDESKGAKVWRTVKTVVRCLVFTVIFGVILLLLARMFMIIRSAFSRCSSSQFT